MEFLSLFQNYNSLESVVYHIGTKRVDEIKNIIINIPNKYL